MKHFFSLLLIFSSFILHSQSIIFDGTVIDDQGNYLPYVSVCINDFKNCTNTDKQGHFSLRLKQNYFYKVYFYLVGYDTLKISFRAKDNIHRKIILHSKAYELNPIEAITRTVNEGGEERIYTKSLVLLPSVGGNAVETLIKTNMGVVSNNELSSQYKVRGGNFDENLIYVNGIQVFRPFLVRSALQEGMSFINSDMVQSISFSAGGFEAKYDDKISSVLSVKYKRPSHFGGKIQLSLLGGAATLENASKDKRFSVIAGLRYRQLAYIFNTLEIKGDYKPIFGDFQSYFTYKISHSTSLSLLVNASENTYFFRPKNKSQAVGTFNMPMQLNVFYQGQEKDSYKTLFTAVEMNNRLTDKFFMKWICSSYFTNEAERFDIEAFYSLNLIDKELNSETYGDSILNLGVGSYLRHARNYLLAKIYNFQHRASLTISNNHIQWGLKFQNEIINDRINEWEYMDSAGYSTNLQHNYPEDVIVLSDFAAATNTLNTWRSAVYLQNSQRIYTLYGNFKLTYGARLSHWTYNKEWLLSPRFAMIFKPDWDKNWFFRFATGIYYQSPFYREMRKFNGELVKNPKSQRAIHFVLGSYNTFNMWNRPFKLSIEAYYKKLDNIIPYEYDNLRIRYYADQRAHGYATGIDFKLYGEFVKGTDSWFSLSLLKTAEDIIGDYYYIYLDKNGDTTYNRAQIVDSIKIEPGYIPRPSDQRVNLSIFFQDYLPGNKNFKVNMTFFFGTPWPFGPPHTARYKAVLRSYPPYLRADLGISYLFIDGHKRKNSFFRKLWIMMGIYNVMDIRNTASYSWLRIVPNQTNPFPVEYQMIAVRNTLTGRLFNLKVIAKF